MAVRNDLTVDFRKSPRIIEVKAPSLNITIQDLYDTLRNIESKVENSVYPVLVSAGGKEPLGGASTVGITLTLKNAQLSFEPRDTPVSTGTATTANAAGDTLIDSAATFITDGVKFGDQVINCTDGSIAEVLTVDSETQLTHRPLKGGTENDWDVGDSYQIYNPVQATVSGGNLVAVDAGGSTISPIFPTAFVSVTIEKSSSSVLNVLTTSDVATLADGVWDEARADHVTAGTFGEGTNVAEIDGSTASAQNLRLTTGTVVQGTVDTATFTPTTTQFEASNITEATTDHFKSRIVVWTSGPLKDSVTDITGYSLVGGKGRFTVTQMVEAPADGNTFVII